MTPNGLTILVPIRPGEENRLRAVLQRIGNDIAGDSLQHTARPHIRFPASAHIHFARFAIIDDPDRGPSRRRLLYSSNYDGTLADHVAELAALTTDMNAIWACCDGYDSPDTFLALVRKYALPFGAFFVAFRDDTVGTIRKRVADRHAVVDRGQPLPIGKPTVTFGARVLGRLRQIGRALPIVSDVVRAVARHGIGNVWWAGRTVVSTLGRYRLLRLFNMVTRNALAPRRSLYSSVALDHGQNTVPVAGDEIPSSSVALGSGFREDVVAQNQLTLVTVVDPRYRDRAAAVLAVIDAYARRVSAPGSLAGISTIHFVRWLLIDDNRRLVMLSDYDGSWEAYIDEFAEMILSGLDAIWSTAIAFPPDGARDLPAFKRFLRTHQVPAEVFYSAYPDETILSILDDRARASMHLRAAGSPQ
jgi:hypothetical protein